ncbi:hypothetical protein ALC62_14581 [Cyphomyrmex costatus]|uniref:TFIIS-type domain-containing protein n=1 Tax=Cyphomyrmex costatus TaxID=456900 RepID=A0A195C482_9HYME|nr:hypothetical protein ALC62_14581 [Cyphomyrmex costatus]
MANNNSFITVSSFCPNCSSILSLLGEKGVTCYFGDMGMIHEIHFNTEDVDRLLRSTDEGQTVFFTCTKCKFVSVYSNYY